MPATAAPYPKKPESPTHPPTHPTNWRRPPPNTLSPQQQQVFYSTPSILSSTSMYSCLSFSSCSGEASQ